MKKIFIALFALNLLLDIACYNLLSTPVAILFGLDNMPIAWASNESALLLNLLLHTGFFLIFFYSGALIRKSPPSLVNLPHKNYWLQAENIEECMSRWEKTIFIFSSGLMLFFLSCSYLILEANMAPSIIHLNRPAAILVGLIFFPLCIAWLISFYRAFRIPNI